MSSEQTATATSELVFFQSDSFFAHLQADLVRATRSIMIEIYIFAVAGWGRRLLETLGQAVRRGVAVYLLVDGIGSVEYLSQLIQCIKQLQLDNNPHFHFRIFHPLPWQTSQLRWWNCIPLFCLRLIEGLATLNCRNHCKCCIIDQRIVYNGSFNLVFTPGSELGVDGTRWCDIGVKVVVAGDSNDSHDINDNTNSSSGTIGQRRGYEIQHRADSLASILTAFQVIWQQQKLRQNWRQVIAYVKTDPRFRLSYTWIERFSLRCALLKRLRLAQRRVWITNAYFVPDSRFMRHLLAAASRGVDVKILLPSKSDLPLIPLASRTFYQRMLNRGVQIFEYLPAVLHAKTIIIDDWMIIGSSNLNHRSLLHDLELDVVLREPAQQQRLATDFQTKLQQARQIHPENLRQVRWWEKLIGNLLLWVRYWL